MNTKIIKGGDCLCLVIVMSLQPIQAADFFDLSPKELAEIVVDCPANLSELNSAAKVALHKPSGLTALKSRSPSIHHDDEFSDQQIERPLTHLSF